MLKLAAVVVMLVLVGCETHDLADDYVPPPPPPLLPQEKQVEVPPGTDPPAPIYQILLDGPLLFNVSALDPIQQLVVEQVMEQINVAADVEVFRTGDGSVPTYGAMAVAEEDCELADGQAGLASWNLSARRASICFEWTVDRHWTMAVIKHELLHTLGIGHDIDDTTSIMYTKANIRGEIKPHHIARIRLMAGLE